LNDHPFGGPALIRFVKRLWSAAPVATLILAVAVAALLFFAVRMTAFWIYWHDPAHREQEIAGWMTPGYIAHSWRVPRQVILNAVNAPLPPQGGPVNLHDLADLNGVTVEELIEAAEAAIAAFRAEDRR